MIVIKREINVFYRDLVKNQIRNAYVIGIRKYSRQAAAALL